MADASAAPAAPAPNATPPPAADGAAPAPDAAAKPVAPAPRKWEPIEIDDDEVGADGKPKKIRYETEHDFQIAARRSRGADKRFREAAEMRQASQAKEKLLEDFQAAFQEDPAAAMLEYGDALKIDRSKLTAAMRQHLARQEEWEKVPAEERQFLEQHEQQARELKALKDQQAAAAEQAKTAEFQQRVEAANKRFIEEHSSVLAEMPEYGKEFAQESVLPLVADVHRIAHDGKYRLSPKAAALEVRKKIGTFVEGHLKQMPPEHFGKVVGARLGAMEPEAIGTLLGPEKLRALGRWMVDNARKQQGIQPAQTQGQRPTLSREQDELRQKIRDATSGYA